MPHSRTMTERPSHQNTKLQKCIQNRFIFTKSHNHYYFPNKSKCLWKTLITELKASISIFFSLFFLSNFSPSIFLQFNINKTASTMEMIIENDENMNSIFSAEHLIFVIARRTFLFLSLLLKHQKHQMR